MNFNTEIFIPTRERADYQQTYKSLPEQLRPFVKFVIWENDSQLQTYKNMFGVDNVLIVPVPDDEKMYNLGYKRFYLADKFVKGEKFFMLDDDLIFSYRVDPTLKTSAKAIKALPEQILFEFITLQTALDDYVHVGISTRQGNNRKEGEFETNGRIVRAAGFRTFEYLNKIQHVRVTSVDDFDRNLQLLRLGYPNLIINRLMTDEIRGAGASGGCSEYRTLSVHEEDIKQLQSLHPEFVSTVYKTYKKKTDFSERLESRIQWKRAYKSFFKNKE